MSRIGIEGYLMDDYGYLFMLNGMNRIDSWSKVVIEVIELK